MSLIVRKAKKRDIPAIQALHFIALSKIYEADMVTILKHILSREQIMKFLSSKNITILIAELDGEIRGMCQFGIPLLEDCDCEDLIEIYRLYVQREDLLDDIGDALLAETSSFLNQNAKIQRLSVFVNPNDMKMVRFYAAMGFHHEASEDIDGDWYMEVAL